MLDTGQLALSGKALQWFRQGLAATTEHNLTHALFCYNQALHLREDCYEVWYERGLVLESLGDYPEAIASYDRALNLHPQKLAACGIWHDRGNALQYGLGEYSQALACYDRALKLNSEHPQVWQNRGNALLYGLNLPEEAIACYDRVLLLDPDHHLGWRSRGHSLLELRRFEEAIACYDRALALKPDDQMAWHSRSRALEETGLQDYPTTTKATWYGTGYDEPTFVEGDSDSGIIFANQFTAMDELNLPAGQPLLILEDESGQREIVLDRSRYQLGRDPKSDICLHSKFVSRQHATLSRISKPDGCFTYQIMDGNLDGQPSTNGLLINGQKCRVLDLQTNDVIVFGPRVRAVYRLRPTPKSPSA
jgi:tetratricopeptide (TPR) repeat protein